MNPRNNPEISAQNTDIVAEWQKNTPKLQDVKNYFNEIIKGEKIPDLTDRYKEIAKIENFLLQNKNIPNFEKNSDNHKLGLLMDMRNQKDVIQAMIVSNFEENPYISDAEKEQVLKKFHDGKMNIIDAMEK